MEVTLKKESVIALMSSQEGSEPMKTVYLTKSPSGIVIIQNLEFVMPIVIPISLNHHTLYLEMLRSYHTEQCGEWKLGNLIKELNELSEDVKKLEESLNEQAKELIEKKKLLIQLKNAQLENKKSDYLILEKFTKLLNATSLNPVMLRDPSVRMNYLRKFLPAHFFVIKEISQFELPLEAGLRKKFPSEKSTLWKVKFDNHDMMRHFLTKFRSPLKIKVPIEKYNEDIDETELTTVTRELPISVLTNSLASASVYQPRENNHEEYIMNQTYQFEHPGHFYQWKVPESAFLSTEGRKFYPMFSQAEQNPILFDGMDPLIRSLFQRKLGKSLLSNTIHFSFSVEEKLFLVEHKEFREKVLSLDTIEPIVEILPHKGKIKVTRPPPPQVNRNSAKKRTFYSLSGSSDQMKKPMTQQSLSFSPSVEKKAKLF